MVTCKIYNGSLCKFNIANIEQLNFEQKLVLQLSAFFVEQHYEQKRQDR